VNDTWSDDGLQAERKRGLPCFPEEVGRAAWDENRRFAAPPPELCFLDIRQRSFSRTSELDPSQTTLPIGRVEDRDDHAEAVQ